jgi:hypothetical protein
MKAGVGRAFESGAIKDTINPMAFLACSLQWSNFEQDCPEASAIPVFVRPDGRATASCL